MENTIKTFKQGWKFVHKNFSKVVMPWVTFLVIGSLVSQFSIYLCGIGLIFIFIINSISEYYKLKILKQISNGEEVDTEFEFTKNLEIKIKTYVKIIILSFYYSFVLPLLHTLQKFLLTGIIIIVFSALLISFAKTEVKFFDNEYDLALLISVPLIISFFGYIFTYFIIKAVLYSHLVYYYLIQDIKFSSMLKWKEPKLIIRKNTWEIVKFIALVILITIYLIAILTVSYFLILICIGFFILIALPGYRQVLDMYVLNPARSQLYKKFANTTDAKDSILRKSFAILLCLFLMALSVVGFSAKLYIDSERNDQFNCYKEEGDCSNPKDLPTVWISLRFSEEDTYKKVDTSYYNITFIKNLARNPINLFMHYGSADKYTYKLNNEIIKEEILNDGYVEFQIVNYKEGNNKIEVKVEDSYGYSSEDSIEFYIPPKSDSIYSGIYIPSIGTLFGSRVDEIRKALEIDSEIKDMYISSMDCQKGSINSSSYYSYDYEYGTDFFDEYEQPENYCISVLVGDSGEYIYLSLKDGNLDQAIRFGEIFKDLVLQKDISLKY